ncbi:MAG: mechanosensitive ion channel domain-containing protein [Pseudomonadota bacterium]
MSRWLPLLFVSLLFVASLVPGAAQTQEEAAPPVGLSPEQAGALADLLRDEATRDALLRELERIGAGDMPAADAGAGPPSEPEQISVGRQIAETSQEFAEGIANGALRFWSQLQRAPTALSAVSDLNAEVIWEALIDLALVLLVTLTAFYLLRGLARRIYRSMGAAAEGVGAGRTAVIIAFSVVVDVAVVALAWSIGYAVTLIGLGDMGAIGIRQTLFLNAFLLVGLINVVIRAVLAPNTPSLRTVAIEDRPARILSGWLSFLVGLLGYGQMLAVPIVSQNVGWLAGRSLSTVVSLVSILILIGLILRYRTPVGAWLMGTSARGGLLRFLARNWHVPALLYLIFLLAIVLTRPGGILFPLLSATGQVIAAVLIGAMVANLLRRAIIRGVALPESVTARLPALERRLNSFVPRVLFILRLIIIVAVVGFAMDTIQLFDVDGWLTSTVGVRLTETILSVVFVLLMTFAIWLALASWIDFRLNPEFGSTPTAREQTLLTLLRNAVTIVLVVITLMFVLSEIGIDIAPLIASAGVLGLAIGFGAQKMVQDIITGVFIQFENAMNVGDVVTVGGTTGTVERLTIRSVSLRDVEGVFHIVPFSSVDMVSNYMRDYGNFLCDMGIAYREDIGEAKQAMQEAFDELKANPDWGPAILDDLQWFGLQTFGDSAIIVRARIKCAPGKQWGVGRAYNEIVKRIFDERGIEIPFPHQTLYFGEDKAGGAPPLRLSRGSSAESERSEPTPDPG